jgi:hypothetical protein
MIHYRNDEALETQPVFCDSRAMSAIEATAEVFVTAFKSLKPRQPFRQVMNELGIKA